ncbi:hypothetical protein Mapa_000498 [Marchantia paleacea]|nr:hypothetical protein Mapa_000498 [Marchantia paleacea]
MAYPPALASEQHPLEVHWVYGFSNTITNGVIDLRTEMHSHTVGYIAGNVVVLFDIWSHTQVQIIVSVENSSRSRSPDPVHCGHS